MAAIINERVDRGDAALPAIAGVIAAVVVALFAYGAITMAPPSHSADLSITVPPSLAPDSAPSAPAPN